MQPKLIIEWENVFRVLNEIVSSIRKYHSFKRCGADKSRKELTRDGLRWIIRKASEGTKRNPALSTTPQPGCWKSLLFLHWVFRVLVVSQAFSSGKMRSPNAAPTVWNELVYLQHPDVSEAGSIFIFFFTVTWRSFSASRGYPHVLVLWPST